MNFNDSTGVGVISITDHAQSVLGDVVFVELPKIGTQVTQGGMCNRSHPALKITTNAMKEQIGAVESVKAASDIVMFTLLE